MLFHFPQRTNRAQEDSNNLERALVSANSNHLSAPHMTYKSHVTANYPCNCFGGSAS